VSRNHHLLGKDVDVSEVEGITAQYDLGPVAYLICIMMAWISRQLC